MEIIGTNQQKKNQKHCSSSSRYNLFVDKELNSKVVYLKKRIQNLVFNKSR